MPWNKGTKTKKNSLIVTKSWKRFQEKVNTAEAYSLDDTKKLLSNNWQDFFGRAGNRKLASQDIRLFKSVMLFSRVLENASNRNLKNFRNRLRFIMEFDCQLERITCKCGKIRFGETCEKCTIRYPMKEWFQKTYEDNWVAAFEKFIRKSNYLKRNYSKVSQKLFWEIYNRLEDKSHCYFSELNHEIFIKVDKDFQKQLNQVILFVDFVKSYKIIEFDGTYWHANKNEYDQLRDKYVKTKNYQVLRITEKEFSENTEQTIQKCIKWLIS